MFELKAPCQKWKGTQSCASAQSKVTADLHSQKLTETYRRGAASRGSPVTLSAQRSGFSVGSDLHRRQTLQLSLIPFLWFVTDLFLTFPSETLLLSNTEAAGPGRGVSDQTFSESVTWRSRFSAQIVKHYTVVYRPERADTSCRCFRNKPGKSHPNPSGPESQGEAQLVQLQVYSRFTQGSKVLHLTKRGLWLNRSRRLYWAQHLQWTDSQKRVEGDQSNLITPQAAPGLFNSTDLNWRQINEQSCN